MFKWKSNEFDVAYSIQVPLLLRSSDQKSFAKFWWSENQETNRWWWTTYFDKHSWNKEIFVTVIFTLLPLGCFPDSWMFERTGKPYRVVVNSTLSQVIFKEFHSHRCHFTIYYSLTADNAYKRVTLSNHTSVQIIDWIF